MARPAALHVGNPRIGRAGRFCRRGHASRPPSSYTDLPEHAETASRARVEVLMLWKAFFSTRHARRLSDGVTCCTDGANARARCATSGSTCGMQWEPLAHRTRDTAMSISSERAAVCRLRSPSCSGHLQSRTSAEHYICRTSAEQLGAPTPSRAWRRRRRGARTCGAGARTGRAVCSTPKGFVQR